MIPEPEDRLHALSNPIIRRLLPERKSGLAYTDAQLNNWVRLGLLAPDGTRVKLPAEKIGGQWMVRERDVIEFLEKAGRH